MKRLIAVGTIFAYLGVLVAGLGSHALNYKTDAHPTMYFIVWDMFCGWSAYEDRTHIIGQGESGRYYDLAPAPWGDYRPFGDIERHHYDPFATHAGNLAMNTLRYSDHEPIPANLRCPGSVGQNVQPAGRTLGRAVSRAEATSFVLPCPKDSRSQRNDSGIEPGVV